MTTIVVDKNVGFLAADRMATSNDCEIAIQCPKIKAIAMKALVERLKNYGY